MTYAPQTLLDARHVIQRYTGLPSASVGITPDPKHNGGYHCGWDQRRLVNGKLNDYSWTESPRDSNHKTNAASALDIGWFTKLTDGRNVSLIEMNHWLVGECLRGAEDTLDIRSVIYTPDGKNVLRWDRLRRRSSGDSSHLTHTHISRHRDAENKPIAQLFERFFAKDEGEKTMFLLQIKGSGTVWLITSHEARALADFETVSFYENTLGLVRHTAPTEAAFWRIAGELWNRDAGPVVSDEQLDSIADKVVERLHRLQFVARDEI